jgi:uncharacterized cysteine cluster protein YcgN (CxxCxxCC family)
MTDREYEFECPRCGHCCQQREWVGLTDKDRFRLWLKTESEEIERYAFALAIEAELKEKNT